MTLELVLVVPCYDEAARFPADPFAAFLTSHPTVRVVLVDDGSRDATLTTLERFAARCPGQVVVLPLQPNRGKAEAVRLGLLRALADGPAVVGFWDADLATPLEAVDEFMSLLRQRPDIEWVIGARVQLLGRHIERHAWRHYLGRVFATAASLTLGIAIYDTQCGAKLFRTGPLFADSIQRPFASRWIFDVELIGRFLKRLEARQVADPPNRIFEYPLLTWVDVKGSKVKALDFFRAMRDLARIWFRLRREPR